MTDLLVGIGCGFVVAALLMFAGYLAACAGAERWLTFREWWGRATDVPTKGEQ